MVDHMDDAVGGEIIRFGDPGIIVDPQGSFVPFHAGQPARGPSYIAQHLLGPVAGHFGAHRVVEQ